MTTLLHLLSRYVLLAFSAAFLAACGGGDPSAVAAPPSASPAAGSASTLASLSGTQTYSLAYGATEIGIDQRSVTATFTTANGLNAYYSAVNEGLLIGSMQLSELSGSSHLQIGRWHSGQFGGVYYSLVPASTSFALSAQQGWAYAIGKPPEKIICTGSSSYRQTAATALFQANGTIALGTINTLTASVTYNSSVSPQFAISGEYTINSVTANFTLNQQAQVGNAMMYRVSGTDSAGRSITLIGVFAGPNADEKGFILNASSSSNATVYRGAARLVQTSSTRNCP